MKKWLCTIFFLFISVISFAPIPYISDKEEENSHIRILLNDIFTEDYINTFDYPIVLPISDSIKITSEFGMRHDPFDGLVRKHTGIDIIATNNSNIIATANGVIEKIIIGKYGYGNYILINHSNNIKTRYAHLSEIYVKEGDIVNRFQEIGKIGKTGRSTGIHLHYEILEGMKPIDPFSLFNVKSINEYISTLRLLEKYVKSNNI